MGLAVISSQMEDVSSLEITKTNLENALKSQFGNNVNFTVTDNGDGSFTVKFDDTDRMYYVESSGEVIENDNILKISTADELKAFRDEVNSGNTFEGKYICLMNDITLDINEEWQPIGNRSCSFYGSFNGNGYEINGIYIYTSEKDQALFGYTNNASIINLGIGQNCNIKGGNFTAGIVGTAANQTQIINCFNKSPINSSGYGCGGIAGQLTQNTLISKCYNAGVISSSSGFTGGITGNLDKNSSIEKCYNLAEIKSSRSFVGGIVGRGNCDDGTGFLIQDCYNIANISGYDYIGGICGEAEGITGYIRNVYNLGNTSCTVGSDIISGIAYIDNSNITNSFYLENTVNNGNDTKQNEGITSVSSEKLKESFSILGTSFKEDINNINNGYPILYWQ